MPSFRDITGQRFGRLVVVAVHTRARRVPQTDTTWLCQCDCGRQRIVPRGSLVGGYTQSCGCLWRERITKHGQTTHYRFTGTYTSWKSMKRRCSDPNYHQFKDYGGRGITVCERWLTFENFFADMGQRPKGHSIERVDNNAGYSPENCVWIVSRDQHKNKRPPSYRPPHTAEHKAKISAGLRLAHKRRRDQAASSSLGSGV